jgi:hypothetical protein
MRTQFICDKILDINENHAYSKPPENAEQKRERDDEIFARARLVNWYDRDHMIILNVCLFPFAAASSCKLFFRTMWAPFLVRCKFGLVDIIGLTFMCRS